MIRKSKINNLNILDSLTLPDIRRSTLEYLIRLFLLKHNHNILRLKIPMYNIQLMQKHNSLHNIPNNKSTLKLIQKISFPNILIQIFTINIFRNNIFMWFCMEGIDIFYYLMMIYYFHYLALVAVLWGMVTLLLYGLFGLVCLGRLLLGRLFCRLIFRCICRRLRICRCRSPIQ